MEKRFVSNLKLPLSSHLESDLLFMTIITQVTVNPLCKHARSVLMSVKTISIFCGYSLQTDSLQIWSLNYFGRITFMRVIKMKIEGSTGICFAP